MDISFSGRWLIQVTGTNPSTPYRYVISGSNESDGVYPPNPGDTLQVDGQTWLITLESNITGLAWQPSTGQDTVTYTPDQGLVKTLISTDITPVSDQNPHFLFLTCRSLDPDLNPRIPADPVFDFTITEDQLVYPDHGG
jgi:hypothetical protein